eukprot:SAG31_NODE_15418_length_756_cov_1.333333_2_plen_162_part_01
MAATLGTAARSSSSKPPPQQLLLLAVLMLVTMKSSAGVYTSTTGVDELAPYMRVRPAEVVHAAKRLYGEARGCIKGALQSVSVADAEAEHAAGLLRRFGFLSAADLYMLASGPEAQELLSSLRSEGVSIAARSKIRLLVGDQDHMRLLAASVGLLDVSSPSE